MKVVLSLLLVFKVVCKVQTCAYAVFSPDHTMCKYREKECPHGMLGNGVSSSDRKAILSAHNILRSKVARGEQSGQPSATNMEEIKWDSELATIAQRWADQCNFEYDFHRESFGYIIVGQNIGLHGSTLNEGSANFTKAIYNWYNQVNRPGFSSSKIDPFQYSSGPRGYTQLMWATSNRVGCGFSYFKSELMPDRFFHKLYVCNYGPGGNYAWGGSSMYKPGPAASACSKGKSSYKGLCKS